MDDALVASWSAANVSVWAESLGIPGLAQRITDEDIDGELLMALTHENLVDDLGLEELGARTAFLSARQQLVPALVVSEDNEALDESRSLRPFRNVGNSVR